MLCGAAPASRAAILATICSRLSSRSVRAEVCGVTVMRGWRQKACSAGSGSCLNTSSVAPARWPLSSKANKSSSTKCRPRAHWPDEVVVFGAASEAFSQKNINCSIAESMERFAAVVEAALAAGIAVRGAMSCALGCPYEGEVSPERVDYLAGLMKQIGVQRVDLADTIGVATPVKVQKAIAATLKHFSIDQICGHFHDTYGQALANTVAALEMGVWNYQSSVAGLGGCPYAKGATGNVATEDLVYMLHGMGIETGIDLDKLIDAGQFISDFLGRPTNSRAGKALFTKRAA